ncbi:hypothetical protein RFI_35335, partial [Reticulomyxa filosa]
ETSPSTEDIKPKDDSDNCFLNKYEGVILKLRKIAEPSYDVNRREENMHLKVRKLEQVRLAGEDKKNARNDHEWLKMATKYANPKKMEKIHTDKVPEDLSLFHVWVNVNDLLGSLGNRFQQGTLRIYKDMFISSLEDNFIKHKGLTHSF